MLLLQSLNNDKFKPDKAVNLSPQSQCTQLNVSEQKGLTLADRFRESETPDGKTRATIITLQHTSLYIQTQINGKRRIIKKDETMSIENKARKNFSIIIK